MGCPLPIALPFLVSFVYCLLSIVYWLSSIGYSRFHSETYLIRTNFLSFNRRPLKIFFEVTNEIVPVLFLCHLKFLIDSNQWVVIFNQQACLPLH
jgi:hypothetical protein